MCLHEEISPIKCSAVYNNSPSIKKKFKTSPHFLHRSKGKDDFQFLIRSQGHKRRRTKAWKHQKDGDEKSPGLKANKQTKSEGLWEWVRHRPGSRNSKMRDSEIRESVEKKDRLKNIFLSSYLMLHLIFNPRTICVLIHFSIVKWDTMIKMVIIGTMLFQGELGSLTLYAGLSKASFKIIEKLLWLYA